LDVLLVDIGGGLGHDPIAFKTHFPKLPGNLLLQDLAAVIDSITDLPTGIQAMPHDFFKPQPVKHAKAYYLRHILHDWPDKQAKLILDSIKGAMGPQPVLLIDENVLGEVGVSLLSAQTDMNMMLAFSSWERTERQFRNLLDGLSFKIVNVWPQSGESAVLVEAMFEGI
jgi:hypothetical protein